MLAGIPLSFIKSRSGCRAEIRGVRATTTTLGLCAGIHLQFATHHNASGKSDRAARDQRLSAIGIYAAGAQVCL